MEEFTLFRERVKILQLSTPAADIFSTTDREKLCVSSHSYQENDCLSKNAK